MRNLCIILLIFFSTSTKAQIEHLLIGFWEDQDSIFHDIDSALLHPNKAKILMLEGKELSTLPNSIKRLKNLKGLYLGFIQGMGSIKVNHFKEIPNCIFELKKLEILQLGNNKIKAIPPDIKKLKNLKHLSLWGNPITTFPIEILSNIKLKDLNIGATKINSIPKEISSLKELEFLCMRYLKIKKTPLLFW